MDANRRIGSATIAFSTSLQRIHQYHNIVRVENLESNSTF